MSQLKVRVTRNFNWRGMSYAKDRILEPYANIREVWIRNGWVEMVEPTEVIVDEPPKRKRGRPRKHALVK